MAIDTAHHRLFSGCRSGVMAVSDAQAGKVVATLPIGAGVDGAGFDAASGNAFAANAAQGFGRQMIDAFACKPNLTAGDAAWGLEQPNNGAAGQ